MALQQFQTADSGVVARPTGKGRFQTEINVRGGGFIADEPVEVGGDGAGPTPYELLSAALAACTSMTLRLYAERKGWELRPFSVEVAHELVPGTGGLPPRDHFARHIAFSAGMEAVRQAKLVEIADKCPVHRTLMRGFTIATTVGQPSDHPSGEPAVQHGRDLEAVCAED